MVGGRNKGAGGNFGGDADVHYLECGDGFTGFNIHMLKLVHFEYVRFTVC